MSPAAEFCDYGPGVTSYLDFVATIPFIALIQLILFIHCMLHWNHLRKLEIPSVLPVLFTLLQIVVMLFHLSAIMKGVAGKHYQHLSQNRLFCNYTSFNGRIYYMLASVLLISLLICKLKTTFQGSVFELHKRTEYLLFGVLYTSTISLLLVYCFYSQQPCIYELRTWDTGDTLFQCVDHYQGIAAYALYAMFATIMCYNLMLGFMFVYKLHKVLLSMNQHTADIKMLLIKNTILTVSTAGSTLLSFTAWSLDLGDVIFPVHFDALFNCIMVALMYKYNTGLYLCLCGLCTRCCQWFYSDDSKVSSLSVSANSERIAGRKRHPSPTDSNETQTESGQIEI